MWEGKHMERENKANKKELATVSKKAKALWNDKRSYKKRLLLAIAPILTMCYTFLFFGPIEITAFSSDSLFFGFHDVIGVMIVISVSAFVIITLLISLLRGKIFNYVITFIFSISICGYIQGNFLNGELGALTGDAIAWQKQTEGMIFNLVIWTVLFIAFFTVLYLNRNLWKKVVIYGSVIIFLMQTVALGSIIISGETPKEKEVANFLSTKDMFDYSKKKNTFVFLLDRLDYDYIEEILKDDPKFFDYLDGFTNYTNAISETARTKPAANYMLTNCDKNMFKVPGNEYFEKSWDANGHNILKDLTEAGYNVDMYTEISDMFGSGKTMEKYVSNMTNNHSELDKANVAKNLLTLSAYRYTPTVMKPFFWAYTDDINKGSYKKDDESKEVYEIDETKYAQGIKNFDLKDDNYFKFYHFNGSHAPYTLKEDGTKSKNPTSAKIQTKGNFNILYKAFDKMKELGIYDNANIIIIADHGYAVSDKKPLQKATRIGLFYKPSGSAGTSLKTSSAPVSFKNIPATILKASGVDYTDYGTPIDEVPEDADITRTYFKTVMKDGKEKEVYRYEVKGDASDFKNWIQTEVDPIEYPFY